MDGALRRVLVEVAATVFTLPSSERTSMTYCPRTPRWIAIRASPPDSPSTVATRPDTLSLPDVGVAWPDPFISKTARTTGMSTRLFTICLPLLMPSDQISDPRGA